MEERDKLISQGLSSKYCYSLTTQRGPSLEYLIEAIYRDCVPWPGQVTLSPPPSPATLQPHNTSLYCVG